MNLKLVFLLLLAAASLTFAEYFTIQAISSANNGNLIQVEHCRDNGGLPVSNTYILDKNNKSHMLCLHPSSIIETE